MDTINSTISLPREKLRKMVYILFTGTWDWGCRRVPRVECQSLAGNGAFLENVCPALRPEMASIHVWLGGEQEGEWIGPPGETEEEKEQAWKRGWLSVECMRITASRPELWETHFTSSCTAVLRPEQRPPRLRRT